VLLSLSNVHEDRTLNDKDKQSYSMSRKTEKGHHIVKMAVPEIRKEQKLKFLTKIDHQH